MNLADLSAKTFATGLNESLFTLEDRWILSLLGRVIENVTEFLSKYHFDKAATAAYDFFWKEFCAYYVEMSKPFLTGKIGTPEIRENKQKLLAILLCTSLRLLHPMAPFITEELFQELKKKFSCQPESTVDVYTKECLAALAFKSCMQSSYPKVLDPEDKKPAIEETFVFLDEVLHAIRNIRAEMQLPPGTATDVWILGEAQDPLMQIIKENQSILGSLVKIKSLHFPLSTENEPALSAKKRIHSLQVLIPLPEEMKEKEKLRLLKEKEKLQVQFNSLEQKLSQEEFLAKAPKEILDKLQNQKDLTRAQLQDIESKLKPI
jgi:valyl-tRNA synthetase